MIALDEILHVISGILEVDLFACYLCICRASLIYMEYRSSNCTVLWNRFQLTVAKLGFPHNKSLQLFR